MKLLQRLLLHKHIRKTRYQNWRIEHWWKDSEPLLRQPVFSSPDTGSGVYSILSPKRIEFPNLRSPTHCGANGIFIGISVAHSRYWRYKLTNIDNLASLASYPACTVSKGRSPWHLVRYFVVRDDEQYQVLYIATGQLLRSLWVSFKHNNPNMDIFRLLGILGLPSKFYKPRVIFNTISRIKRAWWYNQTPWRVWGRNYD